LRLNKSGHLSQRISILIYYAPKEQFVSERWSWTPYDELEHCLIWSKLEHWWLWPASTTMLEASSHSLSLSLSLFGGQGGALKKNVTLPKIYVPNLLSKWCVTILWNDNTFFKIINYIRLWDIIWIVNLRKVLKSVAFLGLKSCPNGKTLLKTLAWNFLPGRALPHPPSPPLAGHWNVCSIWRWLQLL
jgi:hypothetical protein